MTPPNATLIPPHPVRASDADRAGTVGVLRDHWLAGRLSLEEFEARCDEIGHARYVADLWSAVRELPAPAPRPGDPPTPPPAAGAIASFVTGVTGLALLVISMGLLTFMALPLTTSAWVLGRKARRATASGDRRLLANAGWVLGIVGTVLCCLALSACGYIIAAT
ncbi:MAG: DUF1707 SHOCT-like domain-containing protein [Solirubrobacteraceae bacterium]